MLTDLIDLTTLGLLVAPLGVSPAQQALLPTLATSASRLVERFCARTFSLNTYDEWHDGEGSNLVVLRQFPVVTINRVTSWPAGAIWVSNTDAVNVIRPTVAVASTGFAAGGLATSAVVLSWFAAGLPMTASIPVASCPTLAQLAAAIAAVAPSWQSAAAPGCGQFPSSDLMPVAGPQPCRSRAVLPFHSADVGGTLDDPAAGLLRLSPGPLASGGGFGGGWGTGSAWTGEAFAVGPNAIRVNYTAGFATIPEPVAIATGEVVKAMLCRLASDGALRSEEVKDYKWEARDVLDAIPSEAMQALATYRNHRA